jgi:hypothetical protein
LSQPIETQPKRTGYPLAAGCMIIASACQLIILNLVLIFTYSNIPVYVFWIELPRIGISIMLNILALLGGILALARTRFMFAVFGTSVLITQSLLNTASVSSLLAQAMTGAENLIVSVFEVPFIVFSSVVLVLSVFSLIFLARSRQEFS